MKTVMTAAHVVNGMDEITVEGITGEVVRTTIISANAAADMPLAEFLQTTATINISARWPPNTHLPSRSATSWPACRGERPGSEDSARQQRANLI